MTPLSDADAGLVPVPVRVVLPADPLLGTEPQEVVTRLWKRRQTETDWVYLIGLPSYRDREDGGVEAAEYRVWVRAPEHVRPVDGVDYDQVVTERLKPSRQSVVHEALGERRPSGWVLQKLGDGRGPSDGVLHTPDYEEAPQGAPLMHCSDPAVVTATEQLLNALSDVETSRARGLLGGVRPGRQRGPAPRLSWWARRRAAHTA
ncbi:hypothetical protein [Streptomyces azureus]|uniref:hypothetical protein n=1 Tax=Streptomyces azureus TaxID=146537 RepID=UPI0038B4251A